MWEELGEEHQIIEPKPPEMDHTRLKVILLFSFLLYCSLSTRHTQELLLLSSFLFIVYQTYTRIASPFFFIIHCLPDIHKNCFFFLIHCLPDIHKNWIRTAI